MPRGELRKKDTHQELMVLDWVRDTGIGANSQEDFPPYVVDVYIPDLDLAIEIDGPFHLSKRDKKRDNILLAQGIDTWRIPLKKVKVSYKEEFLKEFWERVNEKIHG